MKIQLLLASILTIFLFSAVNVNAQTTMYPSTQPMQKGDPFEIERVINYWSHCKAESKNGDKVYRIDNKNGYTATQPNEALGSDCDHIVFRGDYYNGSYGYNYGDISYGRLTKDGSYVIDQDNNLRVTLENGDQLLVITDQLMDGILTVREVSK
jgi:hypothetical protein